MAQRVKTDHPRKVEIKLLGSHETRVTNAIELSDEKPVRIKQNTNSSFVTQKAVLSINETQRPQVTFMFSEINWSWRTKASNRSDLRGARTKKQKMRIVNVEPPQVFPAYFSLEASCLSECCVTVDSPYPEFRGQRLSLLTSTGTQGNRDAASGVPHCVPRCVPVAARRRNVVACDKRPVTQRTRCEPGLTLILSGEGSFISVGGILGRLAPTMPSP